MFASLTTSKKETSRSRVRQIDMLLKEVEFIETKCGGPAKSADVSDDQFINKKAELASLIKTIKDDVRTQKSIEETHGKNEQSIRLKRNVQKDIDRAKRLITDMDTAVDENQREHDRGENDAITQTDINERKELTALMKQDVEYTESQWQPAREQRSEGFELARKARQKRQQQRDEGLISSEPQPLTAKQQAFIQESIQRDQILDEKLDIIHEGVKQLNVIATDINEELVKQEVMLNEVEEKMDKVTDKLENANKRLKDILRESGGASRWCPMMVCAIILLALLGYIFNQFS